MKEILDAILAGDTAAGEFADLPVPEHYRAVTVHKDEAGDVRRHGESGQGPAQEPARGRRPDARARARVRRWSR